jgi:hypothetical protein
LKNYVNICLKLAKQYAGLKPIFEHYFFCGKKCNIRTNKQIVVVIDGREIRGIIQQK